MKILIVGASGGVGRAVSKALSFHEITELNRALWDLTQPHQVDKLSLTAYDVIVNCAGYNVGAHHGFLGNISCNQSNQVSVNFTSQLLLMKQYLKNRETGHFIYFTSDNIDDPISYNLFYTASKQALKYSADVLSKEFPNFLFTEIRPGKIKSNMLRQNYGNEISDDEINKIYQSKPYLSCEYIAEVVVKCIEDKTRFVKFDNGTAVFDGNI